MTLPKYTRWLTSRRARWTALVIVLLFVFLWPHADLSAELVFLASIPGSIALILWVLTFWRRARIQIGRLQFKYRTVRYATGVVAAVCLLFPLTHYFAVRLENHYRAEWAARWVHYYRARRAQYRFVVGLAHLDGDQKDRLVGQFIDALSKIDERLAVSPTIVDHTIAVSTDNSGVGHLQALDLASDARADAIVWGKAGAAPSEVSDPIYLTDHANEFPFSGTYLPSDFSLPALPVDEASSLLRLIVATRSAAAMEQWGFKFGDALDGSIKQVQAFADDPRMNSNWSSDSRARVAFALGVAMRTTGLEVGSRDMLNSAITQFQKSLTEWTKDANPLEWGMTQLNLGVTLQGLSSDANPEALHKALDAYKAALPVYQTGSDTLDTASIRYQVGWTYELISVREGNGAAMRQAVDNYRAALSGFDRREHPLAWAAVQVRLGRALAGLGDMEEDAAIYGDAVAAERAALQVYEERSMARKWAAVRYDLARNLADLGKLTSNRKYLERVDFNKPRDPGCVSSLHLPGNLGVDAGNARTRSGNTW